MCKMESLHLPLGNYRSCLIWLSMLFLQASYSYTPYYWWDQCVGCFSQWSLVFGYIKIYPSDLRETFATRNHAWGHGHGWASHALDAHLVHLWSASHQRHFEEKDREFNWIGGWDDWREEIRMNKWRFQDFTHFEGRYWKKKNFSCTHDCICIRTKSKLFRNWKMYISFFITWKKKLYLGLMTLLPSNSVK